MYQGKLNTYPPLLIIIPIPGREKDFGCEIILLMVNCDQERHVSLQRRQTLLMIAGVVQPTMYIEVVLFLLRFNPTPHPNPSPALSSNGRMACNVIYSFAMGNHGTLFVF